MAKVLYVEDQPSQRALIDQLLKLAKIDVELAGNGVIGYEKAKAGRPDVILMDLKMPQMDGFQTIEKIRDDPELADTPIIVLSAWTNSKNEKRALDVGADRCIAKPFDMDQLLEAIQEACDAGSSKEIKREIQKEIGEEQ
jgi:CheY-like chemotaxis protein